MEIRYITTRDLKSSSGEVKGRVRVIVFKNEDTANIELTCPECGCNQKKKQAFKMPLMIECEKCRFKVKLESLRKELKKR